MLGGWLESAPLQGGLKHYEERFSRFHAQSGYYVETAREKQLQSLECERMIVDVGDEHEFLNSEREWHAALRACNKD